MISKFQSFSVKPFSGHLFGSSFWVIGTNVSINDSENNDYGNNDYENGGPESRKSESAGFYFHIDFNISVERCRFCRETFLSRDVSGLNLRINPIHL